MRKITKFTLVIAAALISVAGLGAIELQRKATPVVRETIIAPIYTIGEVKGYGEALAAGKRVVKFGPMFWGLYPGGLAFETADVAHAYLSDQGLDHNKWSVFSLSGDYNIDATEGFTNKSLLVLKQAKDSHK